MRKESPEATAAAQQSLVTRAQALDAGLSVAQIRGRLESGRWERVYRNVYRVTGAGHSELQSLLAAVLAAGDGAVASHRASAWLWGLTDELRLEVTVPRRRDPRLGVEVVVHRRDLTSERPVIRRGVACTNPLRTVLDLGAVGHSSLVEQAIDRGISARLFTAAGLDAEVQRSARSGRRGLAHLRRCLERRLADERRAPSELESRMARLVREHGLPLPEREYRLLDLGYRVDFAWPEVRVCVEVDGFAHHSSWEEFGYDRRRQNELVLAGWTVLRFTWDDVRHRPGAVAGAVRAAVGFGVSAARPA